MRGFRASVQPGISVVTSRRSAASRRVPLYVHPADTKDTVLFHVQGLQCNRAPTCLREPVEHHFVTATAGPVQTNFVITRVITLASSDARSPQLPASFVECSTLTWASEAAVGSLCLCFVTTCSVTVAVCAMCALFPAGSCPALLVNFLPMRRLGARCVS